MKRPDVLWLVSHGVNASHDWDGKTFNLKRDAVAYYEALELCHSIGHKRLSRLEFANKYSGAHKVDIVMFEDRK